MRVENLLLFVAFRLCIYDVLELRDKGKASRQTWLNLKTCILLIYVIEFGF